MKQGYSFDDLNMFMKKCDLEKTKIIDELADGKNGSVENISKRSNSRDDLAKAIISLTNQLMEAKQWMEKIHSTHFELLNEHIRIQDRQENKTLDAIEKLNNTVDQQLIEKVSVKSDIERESKTGDMDSTLQQNVPDWSKINFKTSISEAVSKSIRAERRKEKELAEKRNSFIIFGVKPEDAENDQRGAWDSYDSLVRYIIDDCSLKMDKDIVKWEKLGKSGVPPIRVTLRNPECVQQVLSYCSTFSRCKDPLNRFYVAPDRTKYQIEAHKELVKKLKDKINEQPGRRWVIKNGTIADVGDFVRATLYSTYSYT